jgi:hypothetical protein
MVVGSIFFHGVGWLAQKALVYQHWAQEKLFRRAHGSELSWLELAQSLSLDSLATIAISPHFSENFVDFSEKI